MTRKQAEANWGWSPTRGSIPFKRPRITDSTIAQQRKLARPGKLIHWSGIPCVRGRRGTDKTVRFYESPSGQGRIEETALASHIENVNCLACRRNFYRDIQKRIFRISKRKENR